MWCTLSLIVAQIVVILSFSSLGIQTMVMAYAVVQILWVGVWQLLAHRLIALHFTDVLKDVCPFLLAAVACVGIAMYVTQSIHHLVLLILARIAVTAILYVGVMKVANVKIFNESIQFLFKRHETTH